MKSLRIHPLLMALFPILFLFTQNIDELAPTQLIAPLTIVLTTTLVLWFLLRRVIRDADKTAVLVSVILLLVFSFGRMIDLIVYYMCAAGWTDAANDFLSSRPAQIGVAVLWLLLIVLVGYLIRKTVYRLQMVSQFLNIFALSLIVMMAFNAFNARRQDATSYAYAEGWRGSVRSVATNSQTTLAPAVRPNIFYIILDEYTRQDILRDTFGIDNSAFYAHLREKGFYIAEESTSNYSWTQLSLASSLNSTYLDRLADQLGKQSGSLVPLNAMIRDNQLVQRLKRQGYRTVNFASGFSPTENMTADALQSPSNGPSSFDYELIKTTPLAAFGLPFLTGENDRQRERILYVLDHLSDQAQTDTPVFVFAHIVAPHPPFVFGPQGQPLNPNRRVIKGSGIEFTTTLNEQEYLEGYRNQVIFITARVTTAIDEILSKARRPTIIVVQGDHGPGRLFVWQGSENQEYAERHSILNAYYFSDGNYAGLYPRITPVNTFRLVLQRYLGYDLELLPDRNYFTKLDQPYAFTDVTDRLAAASLDQGIGASNK